MPKTLSFVSVPGAVVSIVLALSLAVPAAGDKPSRTKPVTDPPQPVASGSSIERGLEWLVQHQLPNGGWGQGEESQHMGSSMARMRDVANVADTAMAALALIRSGSTPQTGPYRESVGRAVEFVCREVERAPAEGLTVSSARGTRLQAKLGPHIDTFAAALLLAEVQAQMPDEASRICVIAALEKTLHKIENNQQADGSWGNEGWAPVLAQGMASKAINRAAQGGAPVDQKVLERAQEYANDQFDAASGEFSSVGAAGVALYGASASLGSLSETVKTDEETKTGLLARLEAPGLSDEERQAIGGKLDKIARNEAILAEAEAAVVRKMEDPRFVAGFGSNGGEEFLSYLNIGEALFERGGEAWAGWLDGMSANLHRVQNLDGSWTGHHCITGRTFCTAAALMVLTIDQAERTVADRLGR